MKTPRRQFLVVGATLGLARLAAEGPAATGADSSDEDSKKKSAGTAAAEAAEISPAEDLMREHGALRRILLIYGEVLHRLRAHQEVPPKALADTAGIVRSFVEDYHEKLEEDHLFPRFKKANQLVELVDVLLEQHRAGRRLTDLVLRLSAAEALRIAGDRKALADTLQQFIRMYNPHAAREDTVLFPAFRGIVSAREYDRLGDDFETKEQELFGAEGFEKTVDRIASIEKSLGVYDLAQFTASTQGSGP